MAVGHLLMDWHPDNSRTWADIEKQWSAIRFDAVDVLNISPFIVQPDHKSFGLEPDIPGLPKFLQWIIKTARTQNTHIKILAQQFWGTTAWIKLDKGQISAYAASVAAVVKHYELDGYDVDYEWNQDDDGNQISEAPTILAAVHAELQTLSKTVNRPLYVTISPASTMNLAPDDNPAAKTYPVAKYVDWVNIQTYDGGWNGNNRDNAVQTWLNLGFTSSQLTYGVWPENTTGKPEYPGGPRKDSPVTLSKAKSAFTSHQLGGINSWRLTSGNLVFESQVQVLIHNFLHNNTLPKSPNEADVEKHWTAGYDEQMKITVVA